jgi:hypothetical protein
MGLPARVAHFIADLLAPSEPKRVLDPSASASSLAVRLADRMPGIEIDAFSANEIAVDFANRFASRRVHFRGETAFSSSELAEKYDAVVCMPPWNVRVDPIEVESNGAIYTVNDDSAGQALVMSCLRLNDAGSAIFVLPDSFFTRSLRRAESSLSVLRKLGFDIEAAIELPAGTFSGIGINANLIVVRRNAGEKLFAARLPGTEDGMKQLRSNLAAHEDGTTLTVGKWVDRDGFRGFTAMEMGIELKTQATEMELESIPFSSVVADVRDMRSGRVTGKEPLESGQGRIFVPVGGTRDAVGSAEELPERRTHWMQWIINERFVDSDYLVSLLNSPFGQKWRLACSGGHTRMINRSAMSSADLYLPPRGNQTRLVECHQQIQNSIADLELLREKLWAKPQQVESVESKLTSTRDENDITQWIDSLPFPLASIAWLCHVESGSDWDRIKLKLHFFEALSQFIATIHLSAMSGDAVNWQKSRDAIKKQLSENNLSVHRATFGMWNAINQRLTSTARKLRKDDPAMLHQLYRISDDRFFDGLLSKTLLRVTDEANTIRNQHSGHTGISNEEIGNEVNRKLDRLMDQIRNAFGFCWDSYQLLLPGAGEYDGGVFRFNVQKLQGARQPFPWMIIEVTEPMQKGSLHFKSDDHPELLRLEPLVKVLSQQPKDENACYFYSRTKSPGYCYLSYHFRQQPNLTDTFDDTDQAFARLFDIV